MHIKCLLWDPIKRTIGCSKSRNWVHREKDQQRQQETIFARQNSLYFNLFVRNTTYQSLLISATPPINSAFQPQSHKISATYDFCIIFSIFQNNLSSQLHLERTRKWPPYSSPTSFRRRYAHMIVLKRMKFRTNWTPIFQNIRITSVISSIPLVIPPYCPPSHAS